LAGLPPDAVPLLFLDIAFNFFLKQKVQIRPRVLKDLRQSGAGTVALDAKLFSDLTPLLPTGGRWSKSLGRSAGC